MASEPLQRSEHGLESMPLQQRGLDVSPALMAGLALLLFIAPFPLGGNRPWSWTPLVLWVALLSLCFAAAVATGRARMTVRPSLLLPVALPWLAVMAWAAVQIRVPWPSAPGAALWRSVAEGGGAPIAVDPLLAQTALMRLLAYGLVFFLAAQLARRRGGTTTVLGAVAAAGIVAAVFAVFNHATTGSLVIMGYQRQVHPLAPPVGMSGPFVYPNAFGAHALMAGLALAVLLARRARDQFPPGGTLRGKLLQWLVGRGGRNLPLSLALVLLLLVMAWTGSRSVLIAGLGTIAVFIFGLSFLGGRASLVPAALAVAVAGTIALAAGTRLSARIGFVGEGLAGRGRLVEQALMFVEQSPLLGWGLGAFRRLWPLVRGEDQFARFDEVHSTIVEFAVELGLPAAALLLLPFAALSFTFLKALLLRQRGRLFAVLGLAVLTLALLHAGLDFTLQMPANAVTLMALLGVAHARVLPGETGDGRAGRRLRTGGR